MVMKLPPSECGIGNLQHALACIDLELRVGGLIRLQQELAVFHTRVTDNGLTQLRGLHDLQRLTLGGDAISDRGLAELKGLRQLKELSLFGTRVTDAGVEDLHRALPRVKIVR